MDHEVHESGEYPQGYSHRPNADAQQPVFEWMSCNVVDDSVVDVHDSDPFEILLMLVSLDGTSPAVPPVRPIILVFQVDVVIGAPIHEGTPAFTFHFFTPMFCPVIYPVAVIPVWNRLMWLARQRSVANRSRYIATRQ